MICHQCPRECNIDRARGEIGFCGVPDRLMVARAALHPWEEPPISGQNGSGTVFFSGCNLRCVFCQNNEISHSAVGTPMTADELADTMYRLQDQGAHNINFVTPSHYALQIADVLERVKPHLGIPIVWNSGGYESVETLRRLEGLVDVYLPDFKYFSSTLSSAYSAAPDYFTIAENALREMLRQTAGQLQFQSNGLLIRGVIVRHLILPGCRKDSLALLYKLSYTFGTDSYLLSLMHQYTPDFAMRCPYSNLHRRLTTFEYRSVLEHAAELGFCGFSQSADSATATFTPQFQHS